MMGQDTTNFSINSGRPQIKNAGTQRSTDSFTTKGNNFPGQTVPLNTLNLSKCLDLLKALNTERPERWVVSISVSKKTCNHVSKSEHWSCADRAFSHHSSPAIGESRAPAGLSATLQWPLAWSCNAGRDLWLSHRCCCKELIDTHLTVSTAPSETSYRSSAHLHSALCLPCSEFCLDAKLGVNTSQISSKNSYEH